MGVTREGVGSDVTIEPLINAHSWATMFGGSTLRPTVIAAMVQAVRGYTDIFALQDRLGQRIADATGNDAAYISNGAAAGLTITLLAIFTAGAPERIAALPAPAGDLRVAFQRCQRNPYDHAVELAGGSFDFVGTEDAVSAADLALALDRRPTACLYALGEPFERVAVPLDTVVRLCRERGIPVVVDAAAQLPPASNLWRLTRDVGVDVAIFSGGKELRGPQNSGFVVGRRSIIDACKAVGSPRQTIARPLKVGREGMVGLVVALEEYLAEGDDARIAHRERIVEEWLRAWQRLDGVRAFRSFPNVAGQPIPRAGLEIDPKVTGQSAMDVARSLWDGIPRIAVMVEGDVLYANPSPLDEGDADLVRDAVVAALAADHHRHG
jgi:L-seryl-tRNA(Ser) seleniumtransferase